MGVLVGDIMELSRKLQVFLFANKEPLFCVKTALPRQKHGKAQNNGSLFGDYFMATNKDFGVYSFEFNTNKGKKVYIGSTTQTFNRRQNQHLNDLRHGNHSNKYFQDLYNFYGEPIFTILEICSNKDNVTELEQKYIDNTDPKTLINFGPALPSAMFGKHLSPESLAKRILSQTGKILSRETRERISLALKGKKRNKLTDEHRSKISKRMMGHVVSEETIQKMSEGRKGKSPSIEQREKLSQANKGKPWSKARRDAQLKRQKGGD